MNRAILVLCCSLLLGAGAAAPLGTPEPMEPTVEVAPAAEWDDPVPWGGDPPPWFEDPASLSCGGRPECEEVKAEAMANRTVDAR
jgi:hypothetical protein